MIRLWDRFIAWLDKPPLSDRAVDWLDRQFEKLEQRYKSR
jgi:hypothetical protein